MSAVRRAATQVAAAASFVASLGICAAVAQTPLAPRIWDVPLGTHVSDLPVDEFVDAACGTNGGPPSLSIASFLSFEKCRLEDSKLREVWFIYDDELEYSALATRDKMLISRSRATLVLGQPVILSLLIDEAGLVQGYRIFTDPHAAPSERMGAHLVATALRARYGRDGWDCTDMPLAEGERAIGLTAVKQQCEKVTDSKRITVGSRHYYRRGQAYIDPRTNTVTPNDFESSSSLELIATTPASRQTPPWQAAAAASGAIPDAAQDPRAQFIAARTVNCRGCDLAGLSFKRRDLTGADLSGANLEGTSFYRAVMRGADLSGARLSRANLNRADLTLVRSAGAKLDGAMLYLADAQRADFTGASLVEAMMGRARLSLATFRNADLTLADLGSARLNNAVLADAKLDDALLDQAVLLRADLRGASAERAFMVGASLRYSNLAGAVLRESDLSDADFADADLSGADFSEAVLARANLHNTRQTGTNFSGALMPDGRSAPP
jgi:uncharacterized protein YjbI with pentapeptide repeats